MALSQKGAGFVNRDYIKDEYVLGALDDLASQIQANRTQGNFGTTGTPKAPVPPTAISATNQNGTFTAVVTHPNPVSGTRWVLQYDASPNFTDPIPVELGEQLKWQQYLGARTLYFRVASKFLASAQSAWTYLGNSSSPQAVS